MPVLISGGGNFSKQHSVSISPGCSGISVIFYQIDNNPVDVTFTAVPEMK